jgi:hypothetical protein
MYDCVHGCEQSVHSWSFMTPPPPTDSSSDGGQENNSFHAFGKLIKPRHLARSQHAVSRRIARDVARHKELVNAYPDYDLSKVDERVRESVSQMRGEEEEEGECKQDANFKHYARLPEDKQTQSRVAYSVPSFVLNTITGGLERLQDQYDLNAITDRPLYVHPSQNPQRNHQCISIPSSSSSIFSKHTRPKRRVISLGMARTTTLRGVRSNRHGLRSPDSTKQPFRGAVLSSEREQYLSGYQRPPMHSHIIRAGHSPSYAQYHATDDLSFGRFVDDPPALCRF